MFKYEWYIRNTLTPPFVVIIDNFEDDCTPSYTSVNKRKYVLKKKKVCKWYQSNGVENYSICTKAFSFVLKQWEVNFWSWSKLPA